MNAIPLPPSAVRSADPLHTELTALARRLTPRGIVLTVGGGFGLVLKGEYIRARGLRTRFADPPYTRSTNDVDCFLTADLISDGNTAREIREALDDMHYRPVEGAKYYQFVRTVEYEGAPAEMKFDFLAPPVTDARSTLVRTDARRIRPRSYHGFHAHATPEALTIGDAPTTVELGTAAEPATVRLPHPFTYLLLKLHAFRDQVNIDEKGNGRHHAFDIYYTIALATEIEWSEMHELRARYAMADAVKRAAAIRAELFGDATSLGAIRIREYTAQARIHLAPGRIAALINDLRDVLEP